MAISDYMSLCLTHPEHGYYTTNHPIGGRASAQRSGGDFITAPEVSQMFGEMIGVWCMEVWQVLGKPHPFSLVELGPGRGTLMRDLLRVASALPGFLPAADIHLVEISPTLAEQQSLLLSQAQIKWVSGIDALPAQPTLVIGNEFLDALPFRQWVKAQGDWRERGVGFVDDQLSFVARPATLDVITLPKDHQTQPDGAVFETAPARGALVTQLADLFNAHTGAALLIDYGHLTSGFGDTFQAMRAHEYVDPLEAPGNADLTSHVDFAALANTASDNGCVVPPATTQGAFLLSLGLLERAGNLGAGRDAAIQNQLRDAVERLAGPEQMGELFKAFAFGAPAALDERWPGFA
ncbi:MAG: class I SAM-dependent methyltransferase [Ahrensia sp.]|nr:class I SAM-dependent methyltransferase [Ahrensia sp.]